MIQVIASNETHSSTCIMGYKFTVTLLVVSIRSLGFVQGRMFQKAFSSVTLGRKPFRRQQLNLFWRELFHMPCLRCVSCPVIYLSYWMFVVTLSSLYYEIGLMHMEIIYLLKLRRAFTMLWVKKRTKYIRCWLYFL